MTTNALPSYTAYAPVTDTTGPFAFTFRLFDSSDMRVVLRSADRVDTVLVSGADYTLSAGPWDSGGTITTTTAVHGTLGEEILLKSNVGTNQSTDFVNGDAFDEESAERMLDKAFVVIKQMQEQLGRTFTLQETSALRLALISDPQNANDVLMYNGTTFAFGALSSLSPNTILVTSAGEALVAAADASAQRDLLGVSADIYLTGIGGTANAITAAAPPGISALVEGQTYKFKAASANTGAVTLEIGTFGVKAVRTKGSLAVALAGYEILAGEIVEVVYDGSRFLIRDIDYGKNCNVIAYMTANQSIAEGGPVEVGSGGMSFTVIKDVGGNFDAGTGRFTAPATGVYRFDFFGTLDTTAGTPTRRFSTYIADAAFTAGAIGLNGATAQSSGATASMVIASAGGGEISLVAGAVRSLWVLHQNDTASSRTLEGGTEDTTKICIRRVA